MKLTVLAVLVVFASVVLLKADEIDHEEDSLATVDDAILKSLKLKMMTLDVGT